MTIKECLRRTILAGAVALTLPMSVDTPAQEQAALADAPLRKADLRCWYRVAGENVPNLTTRHVYAEDFGVQGTWANNGIVTTQNLFYTGLEPEELQEACEKTWATLDDVGEALGWTANDGNSYNHAFWHRGEIASRRGQAVERIVAFGDSLSDTGNAYNESLWTFPNHGGWLLGRFSNGRVWTEYLASATGLNLTTWANGGAQTEHSNVIVKGLSDQVDSFIRYMDGVDYDPSRTLFTVWIGANDFMETERTDPDFVLETLETQWRALRKLSEFGAKKLVMLNMPDLSKAPNFHHAGDKAVLLRDRARLYNEALPTFAERAGKETGMEITLVDVATLFDEVVDDPKRHGMNNATHSCLALIPGTNPFATYATFPTMREDCDQHRYVFWDLVHPTTRVHEIVGRFVLGRLPEAWGVQAIGR
jgi:thermolabile hemolysin